MKTVKVSEPQTFLYIFEAEKSDELVGWSEEDEKFLELTELFPEILVVRWEHVLPDVSLRVVMYSEQRLTEIVKYIKQNIIKGE